MKAERLVVDSNVLISALLVPSGTPAKLMHQLAAANARLLMSRLTYLELASRLARPKFDRYRSMEQMHEYLEWLADLAEWVKPSIHIDACHDEDDNRFLEVLLAGDGAALITGDADLLQLHPYEGLPILTPAQFMRTHEHQSRR